MVLWVFGYGSLIWRPGFNFDQRVDGFVKGYRRAFHQGSTDHRGTIEQPGRTVTLLAHEGAITWGAAFRVTGVDEEKVVMSYLDVREQAYDVKALLDFYTTNSGEKPEITGVLTYIATPSPSNLCYLGPASLKEMARQIASAHGPSGTNFEYLFRLEEALQEIGVDCVDEELFQLANEVRSILNSLNPTVNGKTINGLNGISPHNRQLSSSSSQQRVLVNS